MQCPFNASCTENRLKFGVFGIQFSSCASNPVQPNHKRKGFITCHSIEAGDGFSFASKPEALRLFLFAGRAHFAEDPDARLPAGSRFIVA